MLNPTDLASRLENEWLRTQPPSAVEAGDAFAGAVSGWFASAMASGFPCATAAARRPQLAAMATAAFQAGAGQPAGALAAAAVAAYYAGQAFGAGVASFPSAIAAGSALFTAALLNLDMPVGARASQMAQACHVLALSTVVVFPPPMPPSIVT